MTVTALLLPAARRAYPTGWHDRLIKAAIVPDAGRALAHAAAWLAAHDIDRAPFRDHRLLVAVTARFGDRLAGFPAYPRLVGLRRMLWTRSVMALREARPALAAIAAGSNLLLIKGAARLVEQGLAAGERVAHDIDVVVRGDLPAAFDVLVGHGWTPAYGVSGLYLREHLASVRAINMFKGSFGDIDLHSRPFHPGQGTGVDDDHLWRRSRSARLDGLGVRIPAPEDRVALAIAHGGLDAHAHSDWLLDVAVVLAREAVDWNLLEEIVRRRSLCVPAALAFAYLAGECETAVPPPLLARLAAAAQARPLAYLSGFLQARPRDRAGPVGNAARAVAKHLRKRIARREMPGAADRALAVKRIAMAAPADRTDLALDQRISVPAGCRGPVRFRTLLLMAGSPVRRRIELELNAASRHVCRIRYRKRTSSARPLALLVEGTIDLPADAASLVLTSRPSRLLRHAAPAQKARYDALPFRSLWVAFTAAETN
jgi:hypothetical protein